ncbi:helix-turn-helix domain-containing protein [Streptomyces ziwulingensis]|uniref:Helix-turn-helix domain-containing protein n=1 Tax=Streptomyces ziwulingensis TaxID=1045501 RepID=A0ABP9CVA9_9ACTN
MDTQNLSARRRARSGVAGGNPHSDVRSGVVHDNTRHASRFTVIGNHLAQNGALSGLAIGLAVHIQSLPTGAPADIKALSARFPEGTRRIASALRELEAHGYLRREVKRLPNGRIITRTISCNQPGATREHQSGATREHQQPADPAPPPPPPPRKKRALPPVPRPSYPSPALVQQATDLLAGLRRVDPRLLLSACDTAHLAPGVAAWLERDVPPGAVRHALTTDLPPEDLHRPAALLAYRLTAQLPPPPAFRAPAPPPPPPRHELRNCDGCDRAFRAPGPDTRCRDCRDT